MSGLMTKSLRREAPKSKSTGTCSMHTPPESLSLNSSRARARSGSHKYGESEKYFRSFGELVAACRVKRLHQLKEPEPFALSGRQQDIHLVCCLAGSRGVKPLIVGHQ